MSIRTRFAPSPTGLLHVGNARAALFCFLFAKKHDGQFVLRLDDTDRERSTQAFADAIQADLDWLGLKWDETARQSDRFERYDSLFETLVAQGHVYACYETPEELERKRKRQLARGKPPVYDRTGLALSADEKAALEAEGRS
ncbi:MAG: glutamate--tRNA ligase family protein, partial [Pseudomonadota bacterium]|nr:glutamate--tRNA ligase family protein [Pseudomonadota bacterium]